MTQKATGSVLAAILILILISFFTLSYFQILKSSIIEHYNLEINISTFLSSIYLTIILTWFSIGLLKRIDYHGIIPYLNLPIHRNGLLFLFILRSYFDFIFLFVLLIHLIVIMTFTTFTEVRVHSLIFLLFIYSIIPQQVGLLLSIINLSLIAKISIVLFLVVLTMIGYKADIYFSVELIKNLTIVIIIIFGFLIYVTKIRLSTRLIDYL